MTFFNQKEEVLDIELTQYGKNLLSQGKFKPSHYLFFDDDILYDSYCAGNSLEVQNSIEARIQEGTPKIRTQHVFSDIEENNSSAPSQNTPEAHFSLINSLGTSDPLSTSFPRWEIRLFGDDGPQITSTNSYLDSEFQTVRIPQIDVDVNFSTSIVGQSGISPINEDSNLSSAVQNDGTYVIVQPRTIIAQVLEKHSVFEKENFDIEVYIKETTNLPKAKGAPDVDDWTPLKFKKKTTNVVDGILVDEAPEECQDIDSTNVEYYFDIFVDKEINETTLENVSESVKTQNMYLSTTSDKSTSETTFEIADIYSQVVPDDACPIDPCKTTE